ncbi:hypothetical protein EYB45_10330 [Erythrobacteraceae bacterium CFH 75059]|uniref:hypothetical protein n=1 Tax=Qipengyuania thermophila TaxID=2509361 RepID=UPI001020BDBB|nr:hypothetical protein [Qipengyuania thermophila]TCD02065.1 hypothetical protein EYB45_10330 [Erythrobacteraceae bacterium CFH 75059]
MTHIHRTIALGCSVLALAACGADDIASPGTGGNITINNPPAPAPSPTTPPPAAGVTPAAGCPTIANPAQLTDAGTITGPTGTYRVCTMPARFTASTTLPYVPGLLYQMNGRVDVGTDGGPAPSSADTNVVLGIEPGVTVFASGASFLMVNRGNRINAVGTAARPIIFTSRDNVQGLNVGREASSGQWGGVVLAGRAPTTDCIAPGATPGTVNCERQVEGAAQPALYGGATPNDNSGVMRYVQIRYSGFVLSGDNELQSLTTGGTGTGTQLSHIMSYNSSDDGVEFFGGFVNMKYLVVVGAEDDSIDVDTGSQTNIQYTIAVQRQGAGDSIIELDSTNPFVDSLPRTNLQISNATFIARNAAAAPVLRLRGGADFTLANAVVVSAGGPGCLRIDDAATIRAADAALQDRGPPRFESVVLDCATAFVNGSGGGATAAQAEAIFRVGSNNRSPFTNTLTLTFVNGANEAGVPAFNPAALSTFFDSVSTIGAVRDANDTWYRGWTCNSATANFGQSSTGSCDSLPVYTS